MSEINKVILNAEKMKEVGVTVGEVGKALGDGIRKHPEKALGTGGVLGYKKIKFKLKRPDLDIEFETE
ncbi:hypothetical protein [Cytobacillus oceanisediminis]|uniref:hypothetical protein n=1 Tax=Cytobacillus oceanisediminis TaxID=665099 RepID=UPI001C22D52B|nr:hypothetical protein [Cytobacillus oceanisediminis]MBU8769378.1 hypothetical protein [Cytobacillus oceanisediminis]MCM3392750.1 hypothetical protein [Cytobacillus oceanisediminis]